MKISITKYSPKNRDSDGRYLFDEWTSYSDIGKAFNGKVFSKEEYLEVEKKYLRGIKITLDFFNSKDVKISHLFKLSDKTDFRKNNDLDLYDTYQRISQGQLLKGGNDLEELVQLRLREYIVELELNVGRKNKILFGYDYYMYLDSSDNFDLAEYSSIIEKTGLFIY